MTDIYIRRSDGPDTRKRALLLGAILLALAVAAVFVLRRGCATSTPVTGESSDDDAEALIDQMIAEASQSGSPAAGEGADSSAGAAAGRDPGIRLIAAAQQLQAADDLAGAREKALAVLDASRHEPARQRARALLSDVSITLATSQRNTLQKTEYVVKSGDALAKLARKFGTTVECIQQGNNLTGSIIRVGDRLRIWTAPFSLHIDKSDNILDLFTDGEFFKRYRVGTGEHGTTPVGEFKITDRIAQPTWWRPDGRAIPYGSPENELGTHWLSLDAPHYGIHGTWEPETIGKQASAGCIRLLNEEIEELYNLLPVGTPVTIAD